MELNKENVRKLKELIVFTIVIMIALWKYPVVLSGLRFILNIIFPFLMGGAIAFILNVPMHFLEEKIFGSERAQKKVVQRIARPLSLALTILLVVGIIVMVMFVVIPELGATILTLGKSIQDFVPKVQEWCEKFFHDNKEVMVWAESLNMDWQKILNSVIGFFKNGAGDVLNSTMSAARNLVSAVTTFFIAFVFACYILLQKEKLHVQMKKLLFAYLPKKRMEQALSVCSLTYRTFSNFLTGQCVEALILGTMFFVVMTIIRMPYAMLVGVLIAFTALCGRCIPDFDGGSFESSDFCNHVSGTAADRGKLHLPEGGWKFRRASIHLGTGSSQYRRQSHGRCRNAGLHPDGFGSVYLAAGKHIS